jgi:simple sugar transport system substrate-binding protein
LKLVKAVQAGTWKQSFEWAAPDWKDINNLDASAVGFLPGPGLSAEAKKKVDEFTQGLASGKIVLFQGPLKYQDGSVFLKEGEKATDKQIWYLPQLLEGMSGASK